MRRAALLTLSFCLLTVFAPAVRAQEGKAPDPAREIAAMGKELGRLKSEVAALKKQVAELKKAQDEARPQIDMLLKHRHSLFLNVMRADTLLPKATGLFLVTTPSPEDFSKTSGPVSGPK
jgi:septal ring factor EnvC (AmiA/AmiB activator)